MLNGRLVCTGINQVTLLGRAGQDPLIRGTTEHTVTVFPLATSFTLKSVDGTNFCFVIFIIVAGQSARVASGTYHASVDCLKLMPPTPCTVSH